MVVQSDRPQCCCKWDLLAENAQFSAKELCYPNFKASCGYLEKFKLRHGVTDQNICGKEKSMDPDIVDIWGKRLPEICRGYEPKDLMGIKYFS